MHPFRAACGLLVFLAALTAFAAVPIEAAAATFRAGARAVDISPTGFPVRVNAMFTERTATNIADPLMAKALALDDGTNRIVLCVVDSCMLPRDLIDRAKAEASRVTGLPTTHMLVSSTHTHSAPSAMGCLGSRVDPAYAAFLPGRISSAITGALERLAPARLGWKQMDDWEHTFNRRWIRRPDRLLTDPFGQANVRAHMHPGYESPDAIGPSGPVDPQLSILAVQRLDGRPLALLANYSQHYYGSPLVSSDYYGRFARHVATLLDADENFVGIMSQGTSGDQMWMDYGAPAREIGYDAYAAEIAREAAKMVQAITWQDFAPIGMTEKLLELNYRAPDPQRLNWARETAARLGNRLPQTQPEIYALEAIYLHDRPRTELKVQAIRIGDLGIAAWPNEVFALSGLKVKRQSPFAGTFNIELANGAEGYIPPPEQHRLGGYTTWPARTAGLETNAEPRLTEAALTLLESLAGKTRRLAETPLGRYDQAVIAAKPSAFWRLEEMAMPTARDFIGQHDATLEDGIALWLPGADGRRGFQPPRPPSPNTFAGDQINRSIHFAGGRMRTHVTLGDRYSIEFWMWNGLPVDARAVTGYLFSRGADGDSEARGEHLGLGGTYQPDLVGHLFVFNGNQRNELLVGHTPISLRAWHHIVYIRDGQNVRLHLDGQLEPEFAGALTHTVPAENTDLFFGGRNDRLFGLEGRLDEIAVYERALAPSEVAAHYQASGLTPPAETSRAGQVVQPPLSPAESIKKIHVSRGYHAELMASEPLTMDPVAIDWAPDGKMWVVEMADYPLGMDGRGKPGGRVRVLEDTNGDGVYDRQTLFADGLNFPNGLLTWRDGVIVTAAPEILYLRDTDGDGKADTREVLVSGLTTGNQQLRANGLRWGLDGWVYCAAGGHHGAYGSGTRLKTKLGEVAVGSRDFRFKPDTGELEPESGPSQFGRNRDDWGHWFGTQNSRPLWHYVLPDRYLRRNPYIPSPDPTHQIVVPLNPKVWPVSAAEKRYHSFDNAGHFTSACSGMIYRDTLLFGEPSFSGPDEIHAFTCEPFHNLVQRNILTSESSTFATHRAAGEETSDFFASEDRWCRPVMVRTGPDGALWVVDMYRYMIEHPDWLPAEGKAELLPHYRLGDTMGRIYRVVPDGRAARRPTRLDQLSVAGLAAALESPNEWQRDKAHMMLTWRSDPTAVPPLDAMTRSQNPLARLEAYSVLGTLGQLRSDQLVAALHDTHAGVRENALRLAETSNDSKVMDAAFRLVDDSDAKVRLQLAFTLGMWTNIDAGRALGRLAFSKAEANDTFLSAAILSSSVPHLASLAQASSDRSENSSNGQLTEHLVALALALTDRPALTALLTPVLQIGPKGITTFQFSGAAHFLAILAQHKTSLETLTRTDDSLTKLLKASLIDSSAPFSPEARRVARDDSRQPDQRIAAIDFLSRAPSGTSENRRTIAELLSPRQPTELQRAALAGLGTTGDVSVPEIILSRWSAFAPEVRTTAFDVLLRRETWTLAMAEKLKSTKTTSLDAIQRSRLIKHNSPRIRELAIDAFGQAKGRMEVIRKFQPALQLSGDVARGQKIFHRTCLTCHQDGQEGFEIGPNLHSVAGHPPEKLLVNILDPSADIQPGYQAYQCELADGTEIYGLIAAESGNSITFKTADGRQQAILRRNIAALKGTGVSLMPDGLEAGWTTQDLADLIEFVRHGLK